MDIIVNNLNKFVFSVFIILFLSISYLLGFLCLSNILFCYFFISLFNFNKKEKLYYFILSIFLNIFVYFDFIKFNFIPQAKYLILQNDSIIYWLYNHHIHSIRVILSYPGYIISNLYDVDIDIGFSYYVVNLFIILYIFIIKILFILNNKVNSTIFISTLLFVCLLSFIMNGRLIFSFIGYLIIIRLFLVINKENIGYLLIIFNISVGLIFTMVSSGTFTVAYIYSFFMFITHKRKIFIYSFRCLFFIISIVILSYYYLNYLILLLNKNLTFYAGNNILYSIYNMLNHGFGKFITLNNSSNNYIVIFITIISIIIILFINYIYIIYVKELLEIIIAINISIYGVFFGYSTGMMGLIPIYIYILVKFKKNKRSLI